MQASFIVPLFNCLPLTQAMLGSLVKTLPRGFAHEIIFVDDGSTDGTREWLATLIQPPFRVILNPTNRGFAVTCNRGADIARGESLFFINNDLFFLDHWLEPMLAALKIPAVGLVGNVQINFLTDEVDHAGIFFNHKGKPQHLDQIPLAARWNGSSAVRRVDALTGACFALSRKIWLSLGGFDEGFINGSEDVDLCLRAAAKGLSNYVALSSKIRHHISASAGRKLRDEQNSQRLVQRWRPQILKLMARDWCRHQIATHADQSGLLDYEMLREALLFLGGATLPGPRVRAGVTLALQKEEQRWRELLESAPPPPAVPALRTDYI